MKSIVRQRLGLLAFLVFTGSSAYAQNAPEDTAFLTVCNKGSDPINVVVAVTAFDFTLRSWRVSGWTGIKPGACQQVYDEGGDPAYIGFASIDQQDHVFALHVGQVPDFGWNGFARVLTKSDKRLCVRSPGMDYTVPNDPTPAVGCASFHSGRNDPGGYVPLASALYFRPTVSECHHLGVLGWRCSGGDYYLDVRPRAGDSEVHASVGSGDDQDQPPATPGVGDQLANQLMKELARSAAEQRKRHEDMQAAEAVQENARAGARVRQNVCISDDLTTEWSNPPAGGKMEALKRLLIQSLRERANTPGYDQTRWIAVDSRHYSAWNPDGTGTPWGELVSTIPGGSCRAGAHREILELTP